MGEEEEAAAIEDKVHKPIKIVSKKQNEEFIMKNRIEQIKKMD